jgi:gas vesicle protein
MTVTYEKAAGGGAFATGLMVGIAVGAVAAMLWTPKPGWELRRDVADGAGDLGQAAKRRWDDVTDVVSSAVNKGRETYDQAVGSVTHVAAAAATSVDSATDAAKKAVSGPGTPSDSGRGPSTSNSGRGGHQ